MSAMEVQGVAVCETVWNDALADEILEVVAASPRSVEWLCAANPHWPTPRTLRTWKATRPEFRNAFNQARRELADELAFQAVEIADDDSGDLLELSRKDGSTYVVVNQARATRDKLRAGARQWLAGKLAPDVYGDRLDVNARLGPLLTQEEALDQLR
jgi:hypothetical protein